VSAATGVTLSQPAFVVCVGALSGSITSSGSGSGYTKFTGRRRGVRASRNTRISAWHLLEQGAWTSVGTSRANRGLLVAFPEASGQPPSVGPLSPAAGWYWWT
jgi:hypothetical protein